MKLCARCGHTRTVHLGKGKLRGSNCIACLDCGGSCEGFEESINEPD